MDNKILLVDDDKYVLTSLERTLHPFFNVTTCLSGKEGIICIQEQGPFAVIVSDLRMPEMDGILFLSKVHDIAPDTIRIMLTGQADLHSAIDAVNKGNIFRFLTKPCDSDLFYKTIKAAVDQYLIIQQAQKMESIGRLSVGVAHDFNNILTIIMMSSTLIEYYSGDDIKIKNYAEQIQQASRRGANLANKILHALDMTEQIVEPISINNIFKEMKSILEYILPINIMYDSYFEKNLPLINGDSNRLELAFMNLCINARDAMPEGGKLTIKTQSVKIDENFYGKPQDFHCGEYVQILISDSGMGMDTDTVQNLFKPFFTTKEKEKAIGLGLSYVLGIVKSHKGFITVDSSPGMGSIFKIFFPSCGTRVEEEKHVEKELVLTGNETILLIEEQEKLLEQIKDILTGFNYRVLISKDTLQSLDIFLKYKNEISLIILDVAFPWMTGYNILKKIKSIKPSVKILITSGLIESEVKQNVEKEGISGFLQKPYEALELATKIKAILQ